MCVSVSCVWVVHGMGVYCLLLLIASIGTLAGLCQARRFVLVFQFQLLFIAFFIKTKF